MTYKGEQYKKLREQGLTLRAIADLCGVSRQAVEESIKYRPRKKGGKIQRALKDLAINENRVIQGVSLPGVYIAAKNWGWKVNAKRKENGVEVCRLS